jgi:TM2 domain-containing membrane protein YozV
MKNYYEILHVEKNATDDMIRSAYLAKAKMVHPDKNPDLSETGRMISDEEMKEATEARDVLLNKERRFQHDYDLAKEAILLDEAKKRRSQTGKADRDGTTSSPYDPQPEINPTRNNESETVHKSIKIPLVASILSFFIYGGAGHIYLGQYYKGLFFILACLISWFSGFPKIMYFIDMVATVDALFLALKKRDEIVIGNWECSLPGIVVFIIGILNFLYTMYVREAIFHLFGLA